MKIKAYKNSKGQTLYLFKAYLGADPLTGKYKYTTRRGFKTKKEAEKAYRELIYEFDKGLLPSSSSQTYQDIYDLWIEAYKATVKESTLQKTISMFKNHILPAFGHLKITAITPVQCQAFYNKKTNQFARGKVIFNMARKCFDYAIRPLRLVTDNPFYNVYRDNPKPKPNKEDKIKFLEKDQLLILLNAIKKDLDYMWYAYFRLLAFSGLRKSEALALTWADIDFRANTVSVNKTLTHGVGYKLMVNSPKTYESIRVIPLDKDTLKILLNWSKEQKIKTFENLVFSTAKGGPIQPARPNDKLDLVYKSLPNTPKITTHGFRHTHCSLLFDAGLSIKEVQTRLGHKDVKTTMDTYNHLTKYREDKSMDKFLKYMGF